ncbi:hypothetical protein B0H67DRAFT_269767 [Lasiosphaeris hirsuta]|uniref:Fork-head domain-containing protein n=1 Tax=Lasiosphaeris hirsuta TaxID=260670 RepID=A0AA40A876_9PEZI|nr:hypothetical protein B0H67DRAFT_269767 [Lasiosphaeris hirsuta]
MAKQARYGAPEPPLQIYQDAFFDDSTAPMISRAPMAPASKQHRRPLQSANSNVVLNPPNASFVNQSPFKSNPRISDSPLTPLKQAQGSKLNSVHMMPPNRLPQSTDSLEKKQPMMSRFKTVAQKPQQQQQPHQQPHPEMNIQFMGKENMHTPIYPAPGPQQYNIPLENYYQKPSGKRVLLEAAPIKELRPAKKPRLEEPPLPSHDAFPQIVDDGTKPNHSYATLIGMAILRSPQRRLTLAQIYKWISDTYKFYNPNDAGWQNSIRHNLSLNKSFNKQERPKDDPGKGHYWTILPGTEHLFMKEKPSRKSVPSAENLPVMSTRLEPSQPHIHHHLMQESILPPQLPMSQSSLPAIPASSQMAHVSMPQPEISSDATIPASDIAALDELTDRANENEFLNDPDLYSPLPAAMHSSPPIPKHLESRHSDTPPPQRLSNGSSATRSRSRSHSKRAFTSINDDSGYISSLESSVMRPNPHPQLLTSEADRPRVKRGRAERGRAEEEIARLRGSSYDSPSKGRSYGYPASSSPLRQPSHNGSGQMLPPLTPAMKLKAPPKPPPSVSPSTNLRLHRESVQSMVDSPYRRAAASLLPEGDTLLQFTPGLNLDEVFFNMDRKPEDDNADFGIYQDNMFESIFTLSPGLLPTNNGSPVKRSAKRKDRSLSTGALNDVTHSSHSTSNSGSFLKVPGYSNNMLLETPSKVFDGLASSPSKLFMQSPSKMSMPLMNDENAPFTLDDLCGDFPDESEFHIDMLSGWEKIGSNNVQTTRAAKSSKPGLGRCYSTAF